MTSKQQVKQVLELALSIAESLEPLTQKDNMIYRITRVKAATNRQDRQGYYLNALNELQAITAFYQKYPEYAGEEVELEEWS